MRKLMWCLTAIAVGVVGWGVGLGLTEPAGGTGGGDGCVIVVDSPAGWQRYSWTGGPLEQGVTPSFPSADWQPNTASDPHGIGVEGAYFVSHGSSGLGDWFYLEATPEVSHEECPPPTTEPGCDDAYAETYSDDPQCPPDTTVPPTTEPPPDCRDLAAADDPANDCQPPPCHDPLCCPDEGDEPPCDRPCPDPQAADPDADCPATCVDEDGEHEPPCDYPDDPTPPPPAPPEDPDGPVEGDPVTAG
jgi:hypothetical protein